jgi:hypothetical protein
MTKPALNGFKDHLTLRHSRLNSLDATILMLVNRPMAGWAKDYEV